MQKISDNELIASIKRGNHSDFNILIDRYKHKAFSMLKRMLKNEMDAEESLQDAFLKTFRSFDNFRGDAKFSTWFYRIVYNTAMTRLSNKKNKIVREMQSIDEDFEFSDTNFEFTSEREDTIEILNEAISQLPDVYSSAINLFYLGEQTCEEIAEVMNTSVSNVKVILHRSRKALKDLLEKKNLMKELR